MDDRSEFLPGLSPVGGKPVQVTFDGGRLTSDSGVLLLSEIERRLGIAERLAGCLSDPRDPDRIRHTLAEMIRFRMLTIAAGYPDAMHSLRGLAAKFSTSRRSPSKRPGARAISSGLPLPSRRPGRRSRGMPKSRLYGLDPAG